MPYIFLHLGMFFLIIISFQVYISALLFLPWPLPLQGGMFACRMASATLIAAVIFVTWFVEL